MIFILNNNLQVVGTLSKPGITNKATAYFNDTLNIDLFTGAETFSFETFGNSREAMHVEGGNYVALRHDGVYKLFQIVEVNSIHSTEHIKEAYCEMAGIELINEILRATNMPATNLKQALTYALQDTDYQIGYLDSSLTDVHSIELKEPTKVYNFLQNYIVGLFGAEISFSVEIQGNRVVGKYVNCYAQRGMFNGVRFEYGQNVTRVKKSVDYSELATALVCQGKNGTTISSVEEADKPLGQDWIGDENAYLTYSKNGQHIFDIFKFDTESPAELLREARKELANRCTPKFKYEVDVELLGVEVNIGDTVYVVDNEFNPPLHLSARVSQLQICTTDPTQSKCVLSNYKEVVSKITDDYRDIASILGDKFPIGSNDILDGAISSDKLQEGSVGNTHIQQHSIHTHHLTAKSVTAEIIDAGQIYSEHIIAGAIKSKHLEADSVEAKHIKADSIEAEHIKSQSVEAEHIKANAIQGNHIQAGTIQSTHLQAGSVNATHLQANTITSGSSIIGEGAIGSAQISDLDAGKINAGIIDTSKVTVRGENSNLLIKGDRLQVFDGLGSKQVERVSLGDVYGDGSVYGLIVRGADGKTVLMDENGVTSQGITDGSITNEKISDSSPISGNKLDINSVINRINEDGTEVIKGIKVQVGESNLDAELSSIKSTQGDQGKAIEGNKLSVKAMEDSLKLKVDSQTYTQDKDNMNSKLDKATSSISILEDKINLKAEKTEITNAISNISIGTRNFVLNGDFKKTTTMGGKTDKHHDLYATSWVGYNGGIPNPTTSYHAHIDNDTFGFNVIEFNESDGSRNWKGLHQGVKSTFQTGGNYRLSVDVYVTGTGTKLYGGFHYFKLGETKQAFHSGMFNFDTSKFILNEWQRVSIEVPYPVDIDTAQDIRLYLYGYDFTSNCIMYIRNVSLNKSSQTTDWTPAPEEIQSQLDQHTLEITTTKSQVADIELGVNSITQRVQSTETKTEKLTTTTTNLQNSLNTTNANLTDTTNQLNNLSIGGRNLFNALGEEEFVLPAYENTGSFYQFKHCLTFDPHTEDEGEYTISMWVKSPNGNTPVYVYNQNLNNKHWFFERTLLGNATTEWQYFSVTVTTSTREGDSFTDAGCDKLEVYASNKTGVIIKKVKVEKGNKPTDWTPPPENVQSQLDSHTTEINSTKVKLSTVETNLSGITSKVGTLESTTKTIDGKVVNQEARLKTAESKITDSAITNVVKQSQFIRDLEGNITEVESKYTELKQTVDGFDFTGLVTFSDLTTPGKTVIDAGNITTGYISGDRIKGGTISATDEINFVGGARLFGNQGAYGAGLTISAAEYTFNSGEATFQKAVTMKKGLTVTGTTTSSTVSTNALYVYGSSSTTGSASVGNSLTVGGNFYGMGNIAIARGSVYIPNLGSSITADFLRMGGGFIACTDAGGFHFIPSSASRSIALASGSVYLPQAGGSHVVEHVRLGMGLIACPSSGTIHFLTAGGVATSIYAKNVIATQSISEASTLSEDANALDVVNNAVVINTVDGFKFAGTKAKGVCGEVITLTEDKDNNPAVSIDFGTSISTLWKAVQELHIENMKLKEKLNSLE